MSSDHNHQRTSEVTMSLRAAVEQIAVIEKMLENGKPCSEVVSQLSAVTKRLITCRKMVAQDHLAHCILSETDPVQNAKLFEMQSIFRHLLDEASGQGSHH